MMHPNMQEEPIQQVDPKHWLTHYSWVAALTKFVKMHQSYSSSDIYIKLDDVGRATPSDPSSTSVEHSTCKC